MRMLPAPIALMMGVPAASPVWRAISAVTPPASDADGLSSGSWASEMPAWRRMSCDQIRLRRSARPLRAAMEDHPAALVVDAIASLGCDEMRMDDWGVDVLISASQKGLMVPPGMAFVWYSERVAAGEEITLTRHGEPVAVLVRPDSLRRRRAAAAYRQADLMISRARRETEVKMREGIIRPVDL